MSKVIDNIEDIASIDSKAVLTTTQTALDLKAPLASPALTGTPTSPTAVAGTNTTQLATTAFVKAKSELDSIGVNQTWQDMTSSRSVGVTYTNNTGKPIMVFITIVPTTIGAGGYCIIFTNGVAIASAGNGSGASNSIFYYSQLSALVPNGSTYKITVGSAATVHSWSELR